MRTLLIHVVSILLLFGFEDISKLIFDPLFKPEFDVFQSLKQNEHISSLNRNIFCPSFSNIVDEVKVGEPNIFKPKRFVSESAYERSFKLDRK